MRVGRDPFALRCLARLLPGGRGSDFLEDLRERYQARLEELGERRARRWLRGQLLHVDTLRLVRELRAGDPPSQPPDAGGRGRLASGAPRHRLEGGIVSPLAAVSSCAASAGRGLRFAARGLIRSPGFALAIVATLAMGIGANTAVFSVIDGVLLEPLPYPGSDRLVFVWGRTSDDDSELLSGPQAAELMDLPSFEVAAQIFGFGATSAVLDDLPEPIRTLTVGHRFFDLLEVSPILGRGFVAEDEFKLTNARIRDPDFERPVAAMVLSHRYWQQAFGGDPDVLGRVIRISGHRHEVVGVMPPGFRAHLPAELEETIPEDVWIMSPFDQPSFPRDTRFVRGVGRMRRDVALDRVQADLDRLAEWQRENFAEDARDDFRMRAVLLEDEAGATAEAPLRMLVAAVGMVLLIACANVATMLLVRASERDGELAIRRALGAGRGELAGLQLAESIVLATVGGALGILLAPLLTDGLLRLAPADLPRRDAVAVDGSVLLFSSCLSLGVALLAGLLPAARAARAAKPGPGARTTASPHQKWVRNALVTAEVGLAVVLVTGTGLLLRSLSNVLAVDPGFETGGIVAWEANLTTPTHPTWASRARYMRRVQEELVAEPGVRATGVMTPVPFDGADRVEIRIGTGETAPTMVVDLRRTGPGALEVLGLEARSGRLLSWADLDDFDQLYAVVDERLARTAWPGESAVGRTVGVVRREYGAGSTVRDEWKRVEVVGVVPTIRGRDVRLEDPPTLYVAYAQNMWGRPAFIVRSDMPLAAATIREAAGRADPGPLLSDVRTLDSIAGGRLGALRFALTLIGVFAALGLTLAATGVYGLLAYAVGRRERELNIRAALGADGSDLSLEVLRSGLAVTGAGVVGGMAGAWWLTRLIESLLFGVRPTDPSTFVAVASFLVVVALLASWMPARRARRRNPVEVLR